MEKDTETNLTREVILPGTVSWWHAVLKKKQFLQVTVRLLENFNAIKI